MNWKKIMKDEKLLKEFGNRVKTLRKQRKLTQKELAAAIQVRCPQLNKYECGMHEPPYDKLLKLAETLSTTVDYLLTGEETKKTPLHNVKLLERFRALEGFQPDDQETVIRLIDAMIVKTRVEGALKIA
jgi:transcriptional regulator with XRE-family HTH domain